MPFPVSTLDLAPIGTGGTASENFAASMAMTRQAEELGYERSGTQSASAPVEGSSPSSAIAEKPCKTRSYRIRRQVPVRFEKGLL